MKLKCQYAHKIGLPINIPFLTVKEHYQAKRNLTKNNFLLVCINRWQTTSQTGLISFSS